MMFYILKRLLLLGLTLFCVSTSVFFLIHLIPGDPIDFILGENALDSDREELRKELKLDLPILKQYISYHVALSKGDWGRSIYDKTPVLELIAVKILPTFYLALASMWVAILIALPLGYYAALKKDSYLDQAAMFVSLLGVSIPNFYLGPLLIIFFSILLAWFPVSGFDSWSSLILPALTLGTALAAMISRMTRAAMLDVLQADYVRTARAKGLSQHIVHMRHAFRTALLPVVTIIGLQFGALLAGAVVTEKVFNWPGIGTLLITEIQRRNYPVVQGLVLLIATTYVWVNLMTDLLYAKLDPRVRLQ